MRKKKVYQQLSAIAQTIFSVTLRAEWQNNFKLYSEAIIKKSEGDTVLADFDKRIEHLKNKLGDKLSTKVSIVRFMPGKIRIYYNDTFPGAIFKKLSLQRPEAQNKEKFADEVGKERIPEMEGDILFYSPMKQETGKLRS